MQCTRANFGHVATLVMLKNFNVCTVTMRVACPLLRRSIAISPWLNYKHLTAVHVQKGLRSPHFVLTEHTLVLMEIFEYIYLDLCLALSSMMRMLSKYVRTYVCTSSRMRTQM